MNSVNLTLADVKEWLQTAPVGSDLLFYDTADGDVNAELKSNAAFAGICKTIWTAAGANYISYSLTQDGYYVAIKEKMHPLKR